MNGDFFKSLFASFNDKNILILGDVMIDSYLWGDVTRISPEAPVPILSGVGRENRLGGAANVALNIQSLGANPILCSVIGDDRMSHDFFKLLKKQNLIQDGIVTSQERMTTIKTRVISQQQHLLRVDEEMSIPIENGIEEKLFSRIENILATYRIDAIIFEDYDKGVITPGIIRKVVAEAKDKGIPTLVDPKKRNFKDYKGVTFFKPNFKEFVEGTNTTLKKDDQKGLKETALNYQKEQQINTLMITLSEHGVFIHQMDNEAFFIPAEIRNIADVSGAGDTVISVSALCLIAGVDMEMVARIANMAGGLVCERSGVVPVDKELLLKECEQKIEK